MRANNLCCSSRYSFQRRARPYPFTFFFQLAEGGASPFSRKKSQAKGALPEGKGAPSHNKSASTTSAPLSSQTAPPLPPSTVEKEKHASKKQKTGVEKAKDAPSSEASAVYQYFGGIGDIVTSPEELSVWTGKTDAEKDLFLLKASAEMLVHHMDREAHKARQEKRMADLEKEVKDLKKVIEDANTRISSLKEDKVKAIKAYGNQKTRLEDALKEASDLKAASEKQAKLIDELKADQANGWAEEKERVEGAAFDEGLHSYVATFLAGVPDFDWAPVFGRGMAAFMKDFSSNQQELIEAKRKEIAEVLAKEAAEDGEALPEGEQTIEGARPFNAQDPPSI